jgi:hypothetical protein
LSGLPLVLLPPLGRPRDAPRPVLVVAEVERLVPEREPAAPVDFARVAVDRAPGFARAVAGLAELAPAELRLPLVELSDRPLPEVDLSPISSSAPVHLPDITRCAASATASAISEPSRVALDIMLLAALLALSAASMPASRIARRALGLAAIAAAAAVRPAASISRLIAALVILSIVEPLDADEGREEDADEPLADAAPEDFLPEDFVREDAAPAGLPEDLVVVLRFAIGFPPWSREKRHFRAETVPIPMRQT